MPRLKRSRVAGSGNSSAVACIPALRPLGGFPPPPAVPFITLSIQELKYVTRVHPPASFAVR
jgi:hypothetical protein